jgi:hypothetical protein
MHLHRQVIVCITHCRCVTPINVSQSLVPYDQEQKLCIQCRCRKPQLLPVYLEFSFSMLHLVVRCTEILIQLCFWLACMSLQGVLVLRDTELEELKPQGRLPLLAKPIGYAQVSK